MNKIHVTYKNLLLPITFIAATLISACDNDKDAMAEAEKSREIHARNPAKEHQQSMFFYDKAEMQKAIANINAKVEPILRLLKSVSSRAGIHSFDRVLTPLLK